MSEEGPRRLRDDPEFLALTGLRFDDEEATADPIDVEVGRQALEAAIADGKTSAMGSPDLLSTSTSKVALGLAVAATVAGVALWPVGGSGPEPVPLTTIEAVAEAPTAPAAPPAVAASAPPVAPTAAPPLAPPAPAAAPDTPEVTPAPEPPPPVARKPRSPARPRAKAKGRAPTGTVEAIAPAPAEPSPPAASSTLPEQLALYDEGKAALARGDHAGAIAAFTAYAERFPTGSLRREARLSMLEALVRSGRTGRSATLARSLLSSGRLGARTGDVRRVLGESQAKLGRCDDAAITLATALQEGASGLTLATVESAVAHCRRTLEASP